MPPGCGGSRRNPAGLAIKLEETGWSGWRSAALVCKSKRKMLRLPQMLIMPAAGHAGLSLTVLLSSQCAVERCVVEWCLHRALLLYVTTVVASIYKSLCWSFFASSFYLFAFVVAPLITLTFTLCDIKNKALKTTNKKNAGEPAIVTKASHTTRRSRRATSMKRLSLPERGAESVFACKLHMKACKHIKEAQVENMSGISRCIAHTSWYHKLK